VQIALRDFQCFLPMRPLPPAPAPVLDLLARPGATLVLVHKAFLVQQWQERVRQFRPGATLGIVQQATAQVGADVVIGMVQSIARRAYPEGTFDGFGFVVIDEAHHMAAPIFSLAKRQLPARTTLALSATPERRNGLDELLRWSMGEICFRVTDSQANGGASPPPCRCSTRVASVRSTPSSRRRPHTQTAPASVRT